jgi:pyruvate dehydrogenase E2 component (dihydrolipoamide acetyltransferase)
MPREIKMPKLSDTMEEGTINVWRKSQGEHVEKGDILVEIETDKADMEFEAYMAGTLAKILVSPGETVAVGTPIAIVRLETDSDEALASFLARYAEGAAAAPAAAAAPVAAAQAPAPAAPARVEPTVRLPEPTALPFDPGSVAPSCRTRTACAPRPGRGCSPRTAAWISPRSRARDRGARCGWATWSATSRRSRSGRRRCSRATSR